MHEIPELDRQGLRKFGLLTGAIVIALFGFFFPWVFNASMPRWPWILGGVLAMWALLAPNSLRGVYRQWMKLGLRLSKITTPIILGIVFFFVIFPFGLVMRIAGHDPMSRRIEPDIQSYRVISDKPAPSSSMEKPF